MGNSSSSHREPPPSHSWTLSYPRLHQKVLPERFPGQRLRVTNNGVMLQTAGTLNRHAYGGYPMPVARFGSEPDLRYTGREFISYAPPPAQHNESPSKQRISRSRKKYKAPTPVTNGVDSSSPDSYQPWDTSAENSEVQAPPLRKSRLFKTHAESKGPAPRLSKVPPLHRSLSSPQFHEELLQATQKLRRQQRHRSKSPSALDKHVNSNHSNQVSSNHSNQLSSNHSNHVLSNHSNQVSSNHSNHVLSNHSNHVSGSHGNHIESTNPVQAPPRLNRGAREAREAHITPQYLYNHSNNKENLPRSANSQNQSADMRELVKAEDVKSNWENIKPVKTFYFGMQEDDLNHNHNNNDAEMDKFAATIHRHSPVSDTVEEEDMNNISLRLRPTLPRKQLDIPRFSPTAAWRLLSSLESPPLSQQSGEEDEVVVPQLTDKSIDSGISGDTSPHLYSTHNSQAAWTPQQDLEETSSDGGLESSPVTPETVGAPTFALSLPRDVTNAKHGFTMLQPSGWLADQGSREEGGGGGSSLVDENWVLSRSVPSSLHLQRYTTGEPADSDLLGQSLPYFARNSGGRVMYLPEYQPSRIPHSMLDMTPFSKSCDNLLMSSRLVDMDSPAPLTDSPPTPLKQKKSKKFTFQSTVRQIERRRIADKLSKQAEHKERQRLMELETMQRVEAEFQRKREREKADIRQQLRLYTHVLSEYKQPSRDYKDYTPNITRSDTPETPPSQVIHPQVVYQMPKNTQVYVVANGGPTNTPSTLSDNSNYRRDFAQGVMPRSGSELSQPISHRSSSQADLRQANSELDPPVSDTKPETAPPLPEPKYPFMSPPAPALADTHKPLRPSPVLTSLLQPFDRNKAYRPIAFNPNPTSTQIAG